MSRNPNYIMPLGTFQNLSCVHGFQKMNGETYAEHICLKFEDRPNLTKKIETKLHAAQTEEEMQGILTNANVKWTNIWTRSV